MRETTRLLMVHLPSELALLTEYMLGAELNAEAGCAMYHEIVVGGHMELIEAGILAMGDHDQESLNILLNGAVASSNLDVMRRAITLGAYPTRNATSIAVMYEASNEVFTTLLNTPGPETKFLSRMAIIGAASIGSMRIVEHLFHLGATEYNIVLAYATCYSHLHLMQWAINHGANAWGYALCKTALENNKPMSIVCLRNGANPQFGLEYACVGGYIDLVQLFVRHGASDFNSALEEACAFPTVAIREYLIRKGVTRCNWCKKSITDHTIH